jgi:hypothetical protein
MESGRPAGSGQRGRIPAGPGQSGQIPAGPGQRGRFPAGWPDGSGQIRPESGHFRRNPAIPYSDETVRIPAFISNSGYISRNQVKIVRILSVSNRISSSMIFILFYINIFMLWIKIDFYKLIWLNKNIKKYLWFSVRAKHQKMLSTENGFLKNDFPETILRRKPFYVETNGALVTIEIYHLVANSKLKTTIKL